MTFPTQDDPTKARNALKGLNAGFFPDGDEGEVLDLDSEKALRLWVEREAGRIEWAMQTQGFYLATTGTLMDDSGRRLAPKSSAPRSGLRAVPDNT